MTDDEMPDFSDELREVARQLGLSDADLARQWGAVKNQEAASIILDVLDQALAQAQEKLLDRRYPFIGIATFPSGDGESTRTVVSVHGPGGWGSLEQVIQMLTEALSYIVSGKYDVESRPPFDTKAAQDAQDRASRN